MKKETIKKKNKKEILIKKKISQKKQKKNYRNKRKNITKKIKNEISKVHGKYYETTREIRIYRVIEYMHTERDRASQRKAAIKTQHKRRGLGFIELNQRFKNSQAHHIDKERIIYIPEELHKSVSHNIWTGKNMEEINIKAFTFLILQLFKTKKIKMKKGKI